MSATISSVVFVYGGSSIAVARIFGAVLMEYPIGIRP
jgi:hypothetical protein